MRTSYATGWYKTALLNHLADLFNKRYLLSDPNTKDIFVQCYECHRWQTDNPNSRYNPKSMDLAERQPYIWKLMEEMTPKERAQAEASAKTVGSDEGNVSHGLCGECYKKMFEDMARRSGKTMEELVRNIDRDFGGKKVGEPDILPRTVGVTPQRQSSPV